MTQTNEEFDWETLYFQMISAAGTAKSDYVEALQAAKDGEWARSEELIGHGDREFSAGHRLHTELVQREAAGSPVSVTLLLAHVEDQMMAAETVKLLIVELIELYRKIG